MYKLYVIQSTTANKKYIGVATDEIVRLSQHNNKQVRSTKFYAPWKLIHTEEYQTKTEALQREYELKHNSWKKKELFDKL